MNFLDDINYYACLSRKTAMKMKRSVRFLFQRLARGWDDSETWNLDTSLSKLILPRLRLFKELHNGHPQSMDREKWDRVLEEMIWAFEFYGSDRKYESIEDKDHHRAKNGLYLFAKYYNSLWW